MLYWTFPEPLVEPTFPLQWPGHIPDLLLRGMAVMAPGLAAYFDNTPKPFIDGGYYTKTPENRPLIGPLGVEGGYICSAFSGFGIMASAAAGQLLAAHVMGSELPGYASAFHPERYSDPAYQQLLDDWPDSGQL
jgi:glycine/D-amino acid oxidase-like deaminating enzyme